MGARAGRKTRVTRGGWVMDASTALVTIVLVRMGSLVRMVRLVRMLRRDRMYSMVRLVRMGMLVRMMMDMIVYGGRSR